MMMLIQKNNCNKIYANGTAVDILSGTDFTNVSSITVDVNLNNCETISYFIPYTDTTISLPSELTLTTECTSVNDCGCTNITENIYGNLSTAVNTGVTLSNSILNTTVTGFCGLDVTTDYGLSITTGAITLANNTTVQIINTTYQSGTTDYSAAIKLEIETALTTNNITFSSVVVTFQLSTVKPPTSRYNIIINTSETMSGSVTAGGVNYLFSTISDCDKYGYTTDRTTVTMSNFTTTNVVSGTWSTSVGWNYAAISGVMIETSTSTTMTMAYNTPNDFYIYYDVVTTEGTFIRYRWLYRASGDVIADSSPTILDASGNATIHYIITTGGDLTNIIGTTITGSTPLIASGTTCINYLVLTNLTYGGTTLAQMTDGIYAANITINYQDGTCVTESQSIFINCSLKCEVADCVIETNNYELMTYYNALVNLDSCSESYTPEKIALYELILASTCVDSSTLLANLNSDCGCA